MSHHDERYQRLMKLLEREIVNMIEQYNQRIRGHDEVNIDLGRGVIVFLKAQKTLWMARPELIGTYLQEESIWRWWWYGSDRPITRSALNAAYAAGQSHGVRMLTSGQPIVRNDRAAVLLANVCAALANAHGVHLVQSGERMTFYALYDARTASNRPAPNSDDPVTTTEGSTVVHHDNLLPATEPLPTMTGTRQPIMTIPPPVQEPLPVQLPPLVPLSSPPSPTITSVHEPAREIVMPLVKVALAATVTHLPYGFKQALILLDLQVQEGARARFFVVVVALDIEGNLTAIPTPQGLMEAARDLIAQDARQGNGRWRRLTVRLDNKPTGISIRVRVTP